MQSAVRITSYNVCYTKLLRNLLAQLASRGLDDFYRGETAACIAGALNGAGSPLTTADLAAQQASYNFV